MLRDDFLAALHDVVVACREAAQRHRASAEGCSAADAKLLNDVAAARDRAADRVADYMMSHDDLPPGMPEEREFIEAAVSLATAAFSQDETATIFERSDAKELEVAEAVQAALDARHEDSLTGMLTELRNDAQMGLSARRKRG
jgi:hypothetical protein